MKGLKIIYRLLRPGTEKSLGLTLDRFALIVSFYFSSKLDELKEILSSIYLLRMSNPQGCGKGGMGRYVKYAMSHLSARLIAPDQADVLGPGNLHSHLLVSTQ